MQIHIIVWARPNFMKVAPLIAEIQKRPDIVFTLIHTGQHFDEKMSDTFFNELWLPTPDYNLNVHGGSVPEQIGKVMIAYNQLIQEKGKPDYTLVVGDVNATVACAITAKQLGIRVVHVEAWLRSFDHTMPEEINRILTDSIADVLFVTEESGMNNLKNEWNKARIELVGNVMIDCLAMHHPKIQAQSTLDNYQLTPKQYAVVTLHRPANVDTKEQLEKYLNFLTQAASHHPLILPLHPRTSNNIERFWLTGFLTHPHMIFTGPLGYFQFMHLIEQSKFVLTDSGGVQEETTYLWIPCLTMRSSTERPITHTHGTNTLVGDDFETIHALIQDIVTWVYKRGTLPPLWDGKAAERIVHILLNDFHAWK
jgi:UDP-N-acetylglucosamine 2-epimerase (non-hydrolysing)